jgi:predicted Rossmann fold flavoprotein
MKESKKIWIIGGGAAGFFAAIRAAENPNYQVSILEKSDKLLSKVRISGGGRCNVTQACFRKSQFLKAYPRGAKLLKVAFDEFDAKSTMDWFEKRGVQLKTEADGRVFPESDNSQTIVSCLLSEARRLGVNIEMNAGLEKIKPLPEGGFEIWVNGEMRFADKVLIATGGASKMSQYQYLYELGLKIEKPVPSLFTFALNDESLRALAGVSVSEVNLRAMGVEDAGAMLITHKGLSGPAVLRLSAFAALDMAKQNYTFPLFVNCLPQQNQEELREILLNARKDNLRKQMGKFSPFKEIPLRLWNLFLLRLRIAPSQIWADTTHKIINQLVEQLANLSLQVKGKNTFKEEFVTAGGVALENIDFKTMQSAKYPGLFFAGEILDIDGVTGGYNFQAAWTTGFLAGRAMAE